MGEERCSGDGRIEGEFEDGNSQKESRDHRTLERKGVFLGCCFFFVFALRRKLFGHVVENL